MLALKALFGIVLRDTVLAGVYPCRWTNETSILVGQVAQQRVGSALQCCVFRVGVVNVSALRRRMVVVVVSARGTCSVHLVILQLFARQ